MKRVGEYFQLVCGILTVILALPILALAGAIILARKFFRYSCFGLIGIEPDNRRVKRSTRRSIAD